MNMKPNLTDYLHHHHAIIKKNIHRKFEFIHTINLIYNFPNNFDI